MRTSTLLFIFFASIVSSTVAFLYYVPVLSILTADAVAAGLIAAFGFGFLWGRRGRQASLRLRSVPVTPINRGASDSRLISET
jgi:hypothetical protein